MLVIADTAVRLDVAEDVRAEWLTRKAWCLFWLNRATDAWGVLDRARELADEHGTAETRSRASLISGYVMDVRGAHARALAWYSKALTTAPSAMRPHVLLEMGTSHSKQGQLAEALRCFDEATSALETEGDKSRKLQAHLLSRSAVVHENLGDTREALSRHDQAIAIAVAVAKPELEFSCRARRARTLIAAHDYARAELDLDRNENLAPLVRRGHLEVSHDRARLLRSRRDWSAALKQYCVAIDALPAPPEIIANFSDIWCELADGVEECLSRLIDNTANIVRENLEAVRALRGRNDIYSGQATALEGLREVATRSTAQVVNLLRDRKKLVFVASNIRFDLSSRSATRMGLDASPVPLDDVAFEIIAFLHRCPGMRASTAELLKHLKSKVGVTTPDALRQKVARLRHQLGASPRQAIRGLRGARGGGYLLVVAE